MIGTKLFTCVLLLAQAGADFSYCDLHPWSPNCSLDEFDSYPAVKLDHNLSGDTQVQPTGAPLPKLDTLGPPFKSLSRLKH